MVAHYDLDRLRRSSERPTAVPDVLVATAGSGFRTADVPPRPAHLLGQARSDPGARGRA